MCVGGTILITVHVLPVDGDAEGLGQSDRVDVVTLLAHGLPLLAGRTPRQSAYPVQVA